MFISGTELAGFAESHFVPLVDRDLGAQGTSTLLSLLSLVRQVHRAIDSERLARGLTIFCPLQESVPSLPGPPTVLTGPERLTAFFDGGVPLTVQPSSTDIMVWAEPLDVPPNVEFLGYKYLGPHQEMIFSHVREYPVAVISASSSYFGIPYFRELRTALEDYGSSWVKYAQCEIFRSSWLDDQRLVFRPGPEYLMRRSLQRHLRSRLREHSSVNIMPEQNINEEEPVDLKVFWGPHNRVALIEIKWLGKSARLGEDTATANYTDYRARSGSEQLARYLDKYHRESPDEEIRGYLAVFDGRRRAVPLPPAPVTPENATYYRYREIQYDEEILKRPDMDSPVRFFCEPEG